MEESKKKRPAVSVSSISHLLSGCAGGFTSALFCQPLQVIKTAFQITPFSHTNDVLPKPNNSSILNIARLIFEKEGIRGFFRGLIPGCIKSSASAGFFFYLLNLSRKLYGSFVENKSLVNFLAACTARAIQVILVNPILIVKTRFEVVGFNEYKGIIDAFAKIYRNEGFVSFFTNGISVALLKDVPFSAIQFPVYQSIKLGLLSLSSRRGLDTSDGITRSAIYALSSLGGTFLSCLMTNPLDVIRTRVVFQHYNLNREQHYSSIPDAFLKVLRYDGWRGFFLGLQSRFAKKALGAIIAWTIYECILDTQQHNRKHE